MKISRGKIVSAQKVVIYGPEGIGKSTFASKFPNPLFIDTEGSTKHLDVARTPKPSSWTILLEQVAYVKSNPDICQTLIIDTADWAEQLCLESICAQYQKKSIEEFGYGKGYVYLVEEFGRLLNRLEDLVEKGINIVLTAHAQMRKFEQPDEMGSYDRWELKLQKKTAPLVKEWADMVLFSNYKTLVVNVDGQGAEKGKNKAQGGKRVIYTSHHPCWDAKNRHNLPEEIPLDYQAIAHCIPMGKAAVAPPKQEAVIPQSLSASNTSPPRNVRSEDTYWHHPESCSLYIIKAGDIIPDDGQAVELSRDKYLQMNKYYKEQPIPASDPQTPTLQNDDLETQGIPKPLADLMRSNGVTTQEIQLAVGSKGYYPADTPVTNYDPNFIAGVLVGAWDQVFAIIKTIKQQRGGAENGS